MQLSYKQIADITCGTVSVDQEEAGIRFHRFTPEQRAMYQAASPGDFYPKTFATAGVCLRFRTDSSFVEIEYRMTKASGRHYGWIDVYEDTALIAHFGGEQTPLEGSETVQLRPGEKTVQIYLPWSAACQIRKLEVEDGAQVQPLKREKTMLAFGDSITQGYEAVYPSLSYVSRIADALDMNCINKGIGGEIFVPELLDCDEDICPDLIIVAYGTNDWSKRDALTVETRCRDFYRKLTDRYPKSRIVAISPIWRADGARISKFGAPVWEAIALQERICREFPRITLIHGWDKTPHLGAFYSDAYLHPNDMGFDFYAANILPEIREALLFQG